jgi:phage tail-like protein
VAHSLDFQKTNYPLAVYNFRVKVDQAELSFAEVNGIAVEYDHAVYRHGLTFLEGESIQTFYFDSFKTMTCKRGTILGKNPLFLHEWLTQRDTRSMEVSLCDEKGAAVLSWKIAYAVPVALKAPSFTAASNEAAIETVELRVRGVSVVKL